MSDLSNLKSVLVVEDEFLIAADIELIFTEKGCRDVEVTSTCLDAISRLDERSYDLVTVDVELRDESCERLVARLNEKNIPFLYVSGFTEDDQSNLPPAPWLLKPMSDDELVAAVNSLFS